MVRASKSLAAGGAATVFPELYGVVKFFRSRFGRESSHQLYLVRFVLLSSRFFNHIFVALVGGGRIDVSPTKGKGLSSGRVPLLDVGGAGRVSGHFLHWGDFDTLNSNDLQELSSENACDVADDDAVAILSGNSRVSSVRSSGIKDSLDQARSLLSSLFGTIGGIPTLQCLQAVESGRGSPTILEHSVEEEVCSRLLANGIRTTCSSRNCFFDAGIY